MLLDYIRSSVEILISMPHDQKKAGKQFDPNHSGSSASLFSSAPSADAGNGGSRSSASGMVCSQEHEEMLRKFEGDVRMHIRIEQQMKLHIETLQDKIDEQTKKMEEEARKFEDGLLEVKREKRRLDDLLTLREKEVSGLEDKLKQAGAKYYRTLGFTLFRYEKDIGKMLLELKCYKNALSK